MTSGKGIAEPLLERGADLARLDAALQGACSGAGTTVLVEGPAGIGKTSLLTWARRRAAARGMTVLHASGSQLERDYAMGVVRQSFEPELRRHDDPDVLLAGTARLAARAVLDVPDEEDPAPGAVLHGLYWLTANVADRAPVLLAIDDAHWSDKPSLLFVAYLARRVDSLPVALILGTRPAEDATVAAVFDEVRREPTTIVVEPAPLQAAGVDELLRAVQTGPVEREFAAACHEATGGNPFLLGELVRALRADAIPFTAIHADRVTEVTLPTVARTVRATLARLGPARQALARAVAVLGDRVDLDLVAELADVPMDEAALAATELTRASVLDDAAPLRFRHPLLAGAVRATMSSPERAVAHARAAALLRGRHAGPERVALQLMHTGPAGDAEVAAELSDAAARARRRGAPATVIELLRRALAEPPPQAARADVLLELGRAEAAMGRSGDAATHLEEAHRYAVDPVVRGQAVLSLFNAVGGQMQRLRELEPLIARTREELAEHDRELAMRLWAIHAVATTPAELPDVQAGALELPGDTPGEALVLGHCVFPMLHHATGAEVTGVAERAARQARPLLDEGAMALVFSAIYPGLFALDRLDELVQLLDYAIAASRRRGSTAEVSLAYGARGAVRRRSGRLREAEGDARIAVAAAGEAGWAGGGMSALIPLVGVLVDQGRTTDAEHELAAVFPDGAAIPDSPATNFLFFERIQLRAAQARYAEAIDEFDEAVRRFERVFGIDSVQWTAACCAAAEAHAALGDRAAATALVTRALGVARRWGVPGFIGQALHARARIEERDAAIETMREAIAQLERSPARLEHARALVALGALLRRRGRRVESREPLRAGYALANACSAEALADIARAELRASGIRIRRETSSGADALTASERRIAEMAAAGSSNAEVAQALFLTVKTVEMHLTSVYRKLGIHSRHALPAALGG